MAWEWLGLIDDKLRRMQLDMEANSDLARKRGLDEASGRLNARLGEEETFGTPFTPQAQDLLDYETVSGSPYPQRRLTVGEIMAHPLQQATGFDKAVNLPGDESGNADVIAQPLSADQRARRAALQQAGQKETAQDLEDAAEERRRPTQFGRLKNFLGEDFSRDDVLANMGFKRADTGEAQETWGPMFKGPGDSYLQQSNRGKIGKILGREDTGQTGEEDRIKLQRNFRGDTLRLYGASEFSSLDESLRPKVNEISVRATRNYLADPARDYNRALSDAYSSVEAKHGKLGKLPRPKEELVGSKKTNIEEAARQVLDLNLDGVPGEEIAKALVAKGWTKDELKLIGEAADQIEEQHAGSAAGGPRVQGAPVSDGAQNAAELELRRQYRELRRSGLTPEQAAQKLGIPMQ